MPTNEEIAIWLGWRYETATVDAEAGWYPPNEAYDENLPDWRGDPWRWVEVMDKVQRLGYVVHFVNNHCDIWKAPVMRDEPFHGHTEAGVLGEAFWAAFDAWWEAEHGKGE